MHHHVSPARTRAGSSRVRVASGCGRHLLGTQEEPVTIKTVSFLLFCGLRYVVIKRLIGILFACDRLAQIFFFGLKPVFCLAPVLQVSSLRAAIRLPQSVGAFLDDFLPVFIHVRSPSLSLNAQATSTGSVQDPLAILPFLTPKHDKHPLNIKVDSIQRAAPELAVTLECGEVSVSTAASQGRASSH
jgi:hypothetical protein